MKKGEGFQILSTQGSSKSRPLVGRKIKPIAPKLLIIIRLNGC